MGDRARIVLAGAMLVATGLVPARADDRDVTRLAAASIELCKQAQPLPADEGRALLRRGLALAERAVARNEQDARAQFAVFCNLGKLIELDGIGWGTIGDVRRVRQAAERAVTLAPDDVDALVGRGALLLRLPRFLGGDHEEAERCLERALRLDPWHSVARAYLDGLRSDRAAVGAALSSALRAE
jgi:tetratricopeptide (TPR) repeat protein